LARLGAAGSPPLPPSIFSSTSLRSTAPLSPVPGHCSLSSTATSTALTRRPPWPRVMKAVAGGGLPDAPAHRPARAAADFVLAVIDLVPELARVRLGVLHIVAVAAGHDDQVPAGLALDPGAELDGGQPVAQRLLQEAGQFRTDPRGVPSPSPATSPRSA
jgi:hypothetical protein